MANTTEDFWKMLFERECAVIIMLSDTKEKGKVHCNCIIIIACIIFIPLVISIDPNEFSGDLLSVLAKGQG